MKSIEQEQDVEAEILDRKIERELKDSYKHMTDGSNQLAQSESQWVIATCLHELLKVMRRK